MNKVYALYKCPSQSHFQFDHNQTPPYVSKSNLNPTEQLSAPACLLASNSFSSLALARPPNPNCIGFWPLLDHISPSLSSPLLYSFCNAVSLSITPLALSARCKLFAAECKSSPQCDSKHRIAPQGLGPPSPVLRSHFMIKSGHN